MSRCDDKVYVLKAFPVPIFEQAQWMGRELSGFRFVRLPVVTTKDEPIIVYGFKAEDLKSFVMRHNEIPVTQPK